MAEIIKGPKGVPVYLPPQSATFLAVREALTSPARHAGYGYIELPVYEDTSLFVRGVGESTDVVSKEMFTFTDRGERSITLRPEGTAGVMRAVIEHGLDKGQLPVKIYYAAPFFRAERPQFGRYRQLQQVGIEAIGADDPALDAEVIALADEGYRSLGLSRYELRITSLGCANCRPAYRALLQDFLRGLELDDETQERARVNPLRVLDDKRMEVQRQLTHAPLQVDHLCADCAEHYRLVKHYLLLLNVPFVEFPRLVRGLDYYTRTTFEFDHPLLGAQSGIGGGGRYDGLMTELGGAPLSGIGFGLGTDRTMIACDAEGLTVGDPARCDVFLVPLGSEAKDYAVRLAGQLRRVGVRVDMAYGDRALKGSMKAADRSGARYAVVIGDRELADGALPLKSLATGEQELVPADSLVQTIVGNLEA
ncbi:MAG: histidine--tRNA ligase [Candidatus Nanopelagicales bacterium]